MTVTAETAATAAGYLALAFISQPETWPVFREWAKTHSDVPVLWDLPQCRFMRDVMSDRMLKEAAGL